MANTQEIPPSRLSLSTAKLRDDLESRNLYTPDSEYPLQSTQNSAKVVSTINTVIGALTPFKSYNLENTVYGRLIQGNANTPLAQIGLAMLGKQMALNMMSNASQQLLPVIKVSNLFDGNPSTNLFTPHVDFSITKIATNSNLSDFISRIVGTKNPSRDPFSESSTNSTYLSNTGSGQLVFMLDQLNKNIYKSSNTNLNQIATEVKDPIQPRYNLVSVGNKSFFNFTNGEFNPYIKYHPSTMAEVAANASMINAYNGVNVPTQTYTIPLFGGGYTTVAIPENSVLNQEYAPDQNFVNNLGYTQKYSNNKRAVNSALPNEWIGDNTEFVNDQEKKIAWGWNGITQETAGILNDTIGTFGGNGLAEDNSFNADFGVQGAGLLEYTKNLVNASNGRIADITRKAFMSGDEIAGFNGSALWRANNSTYARKSGTAGYTGVRQHSTLDQYDRFAKAIRFNGNNVYNGNPDSVIYKTVMPRIHPTMDKVKDGLALNNKNLMLSIENLAIRVISKDNVGIIDDEYGSQIPLCEVGPFNGRMMWFPPYNLELNETATAKYEPTVMVGRNEPMYNYQNSERSATLNFTLLIDYPPQVKNYDGSKTHQKDVAEFFAFGGDTPPVRTNIDKLPMRIHDLEIEREKIINRRKPKPVEQKTSPIFQMFFPNDEPHASNKNTIVDEMYQKGYEVSPVVITTIGDGKSEGMNRSIFYIHDLQTIYIDGAQKFVSNGSGISQYKATGTTDDFGTAAFNQALLEMFQNEDDRPLYSIYIEGHTSALATSAYNFELSKRRIAAAKHFVEEKIKAMFGANAINSIGVITTKPLGEVGATPAGATAAAISEIPVKQDRWASIQFKNNGNTNPKDLVPATEQDVIDLANIELQLSALQGQLNNSTKQPAGGANLANCTMTEKEESSAAILHGFQAMKGNYYQPVFHSQTPEDFHKRLTFLQQCTRQGSSRIYESKPDETGVLRARNSVFGRQPICILRVGDFFYTKVIIESINFDYVDTTWDMNPEGFGMQPMMAKITLNMKIIGGQSLKGPIDALQNAVAFNYYANSTYTNEGIYKLPSYVASQQETYINGVNAANVKTAQNNFDSKLTKNFIEGESNIFSYVASDKYEVPPKK